MAGAPTDPARVAVVDLGSNSTRLLVADVRDGRVEKLDRRTQVTRLGEGVDASNRLTDEAMERVYDTVAGYREAIDDLGAELTVGVATSAVREADNREDFLGGLSERFGVDARPISGEEEARLTFLGATAGRTGGKPTLVLDIGGGSTEFVAGPPGTDPEFHASTRAGSVRQTERHFSADPPPPSELDSLRSEVRAIIEEAVPAEIRRWVREGIAVAGTATSLASIDQQLEPYDPSRVHGHRLGLDDCERMLAMLAALPLSERREVTGLHPDRAPMIVAGAAIFVEAARAFELDEMEISEADILYGTALSAVRGEL
ncbi:MAG: Ppx/GppA family phosphatase [Actinomycetota bacterium]|nr:Ppx/GppA family phosphatase [Actinomycetota bacterium]